MRHKPPGPLPFQRSEKPSFRPRPGHNERAARSGALPHSYLAAVVDTTTVVDDVKGAADDVATVPVVSLSRGFDGSFSDPSGSRNLSAVRHSSTRGWQSRSPDVVSAFCEDSAETMLAATTPPTPIKTCDEKWLWLLCSVDWGSVVAMRKNPLVAILLTC